MITKRGALLGVAALTVFGAWNLPAMCGRLERVPTAAAARALWEPSDAVVLDRNGRPLNEVRVDDQHRRLEWTSLDAISPALREAMIVSEDHRFGRHRGVDAIAIGGVLGRTLLGERLRGASTITMQVAAMLTSDLARNGGPRSVAQKWRQMRRAWALERTWTKAEILEAYLNLVTFRGELQGVAAASRLLLGKAPSGVTDGEALVLASLVRAPNADSDAVARRARMLRAAMHGDVADAEIVRVAGRLTNTPTTAVASLAPHLARRLVAMDTDARTIETTIDALTQAVAVQALQQQLLALRGKRVRDGAVLVVDNASGDVLAYVGGSGSLSSGRYVDAVSAHRQAGSTLKPFLYATAFERRLLTPASLIDDSPLDVPVFGGLYRPENYDELFNGTVSARTALAGSLNIPAVRVLALVGADGFVEQLRRLGFARLQESGDYYGPALALGAADVSLEELANAFRSLGNEGRFSALRFRRDARASVFEPVYSRAAAFLVSNVLADRESRSVTFGLESPLATRFWSAVKTGTSKSMRDNWCIGYSERFTVAVWVGNLSGRPMRGVSGMSGAAPVWVEIMEWLHRDGAGPAPAVPAGVVGTQVISSTGGTGAQREWFIEGTEPSDRMLEPARGRARIAAPVGGTVVALDPDIPIGRQRVSFRAEVSASGQRWLLDGVDIGPASGVVLWPPQTGTHSLVLVTADGSVLDRVSFAVRGAPQRPAQAAGGVPSETVTR